MNCVESGGDTITCSTPANSDGTVDLTVVNVDGQSSTAVGAYTFQNVTPTITSITPATGPTNGGTAVTIAGGNFQVGAQVTIGGLPAGDIVVQDPATITATTPGLPAGAAVDVTVSNQGTPATKIGAFTYTAGTGAINYIQRGSTGSATPSATLSTTMPGVQTAGNLNVVIVGWSDTTSTISSVTDSEGNTYTLALPAVNGTGISQSIYYAKSIVGDTGSPNQITVTFNQAAAAPDLRVLEYSGLDITSPLDTATGTFGAGTLAATGACTTTNAVELIVGAGTTDTHFTGPGTGFNLVDISQPNGDSSEHQITSAAGSCQASSPLVTGNWVMQAAAFKAAPAPVPDFTITASALTPASVAAGGTATSTITIAAVNGFTDAVDLTCAVTPVVNRAATCSFNPASVAGGAGSSVMTVSTTAATTASLAPQSRGIFFAMLLPIGGLALLGTGLTPRRRKLFGFVLGCMLFSGLMFLSACGGSSSSGGGGGHPGTPAGIYTITVTGTGPSGTPVHTATTTLTVQ